MEESSNAGVSSHPAVVVILGLAAIGLVVFFGARSSKEKVERREAEKALVQEK